MSSKSLTVGVSATYIVGNMLMIMMVMTMRGVLRMRHHFYCILYIPIHKTVWQDHKTKSTDPNPRLICVHTRYKYLWCVLIFRCNQLSILYNHFYYIYIFRFNRLSITFTKNWPNQIKKKTINLTAAAHSSY